MLTRTTVKKTVLFFPRNVVRESADACAVRGNRVVGKVALDDSDTRVAGSPCCNWRTPATGRTLATVVATLRTFANILLAASRSRAVRLVGPARGTRGSRLGVGAWLLQHAPLLPMLLSIGRVCFNGRFIVATWKQAGLPGMRRARSGHADPAQ